VLSSEMSGDTGEIQPGLAWHVRSSALGWNQRGASEAPQRATFCTGVRQAHAGPGFPRHSGRILSLWNQILMRRQPVLLTS